MLHFSHFPEYIMADSPEWLPLTELLDEAVKGT